MKKINYFSIIFCFLVLLLNNCSVLKKESEQNQENSRNFFVETVAKPDSTLKGLKVSLPKPLINNGVLNCLKVNK